MVKEDCPAGIYDKLVVVIGLLSKSMLKCVG